MNLFSFATVASTVTMVSASAFAGSVLMHGIADDSTRYVEPASGAEMVVGDYWNGTNRQRFHAIGDTSVWYGQESFDGFPNDGNFRLGRITFDETGIGGNGIAPITGLTVGFGSDPENASYINFGRWTGVTTTVDSFSGTVTLIDGTVTAANLTADVSLFIPSAVNVQMPGSGSGAGTFTVSGNAFTGDASVASAAFGGFDSEGGIIWNPASVTYDMQGTLTTIPEPATLGLAGIAAMIVGRRRVVGGRR